MVRDVIVSLRWSERRDLSSALERELDREWFRDWEREDLSLEEGDEDDDDEESSPRETLSTFGIVDELGRGVAPIKGLRMHGMLSCNTLVKDGARVPGGGPPGPSDARRVEEGFDGVMLTGELVRSE